MRNFFILCEATALASAVSLSHVNANENNEFDMVEGDYDEQYMDEQYMVEQDESEVERMVAASMLSQLSTPTGAPHWLRVDNLDWA